MKAVLALLLLLVLSLPVAATPHLAVQTMAAASGAQLSARLSAQYADVNAQLRDRAEKNEQWQVAKRAREAAAVMVESMKASGTKGEALDIMLRNALLLDEEAVRSRSALLQAESRLAHAGATLLTTFTSLLQERRARINHRAGASKKRAIAAYRALAQKRDEVRQLLAPVLRQEPSVFAAANLSVSEADDVEALLEKADLARDMEERFLRKMRVIQKRIHELEIQRDLAVDVADLDREAALFDEGAPRLRVTGALANVEARPNLGGGGSDELSVAPAPPSEGGVAPSDPDPNAINGDEARQSFNDVSGTPPRGVADRIVVGTTDSEIQALLSSGELGLKELKVMKDRLKSQANEAKMKRIAIDRALKERRSP